VDTPGSGIVREQRDGDRVVQALAPPAVAGCVDAAADRVRPPNRLVGVPVTRVTGLWVYQMAGRRSRPEAVTARAQRHGIKWLTVQAIEGEKVLDRDWLRAMRRATKERDMRLAVHGFIGRPHPKPAAEARAMARAIDVAEADFAIVNAEIQYEQAPPASQAFVNAYRRLKPAFPSFLSSFGRPQLHPSLDWAAWASGGFRGMPQAYENLNAEKLKPILCVNDWARFFERRALRPTLGCFAERHHSHLPIPRLVQSVREVPRLPFNIFRHGTVTTAELEALSAVI
jgi:hypothetical protein